MSPSVLRACANGVLMCRVPLCCCCCLQSELRTQLDGDTLAVLDTIMATEEMEAVAMQQEQAAHMLQDGHCEPAVQQAVQAAVHIEELHDSPRAEVHDSPC